MGHTIIDCDRHFEIDPISRIIKPLNPKTSIVQFDHNSERLTFSMPRYVEGHDMAKCTNVEVHYSNVDARTKNESVGVYPITDMQIDPDDEQRAIFTWLISRNATQKVGALEFSIRFTCVDEDANILYSWNTSIFSSITVLASLYNTDELSATEYYPEVFAQWKNELESTIGAIAPHIDDNGNWVVWDNEAKVFVDTGVKAKGHTPVRGTDYWTELDKREIQKGIKLPLIKGVFNPSGVYNPNLVTLWLDGAGDCSFDPDSAGNYSHFAAGNNEVGFIFPIDETIDGLLGKYVTYSITINEADFALWENGESNEESLSSAIHIGLAFVKFEHEYYDDVVTKFTPIESNSISEMRAYTYSTVLPEDIPEGYENEKLAIYAMFNFTDFIDGNFVVSNPRLNVAVENSDGETIDMWFVWDAISKRYVNSGVSAKSEDGYTPQRGIDYWTEEDKAEIKSYIDEAIQVKQTN